MAMEDEATREDENSQDVAEEAKAETADTGEGIGGGAPEMASMEDIEEVEGEPLSIAEEGEGKSKALKKSIGLGLPADRYRIVLPKASFPPLNSRQQFIARLRDRDRVSFRIFEGDEDLASENEFLAELGLIGIALNNEDKAFLEIDFHLNLDMILRVRLLDKFGEKEAFVVLDMAKRPKAALQQDNVAKLLEKIDALEGRMEEISKNIVSTGKGGAKK
jgi:hypothetical protein